MSTQLDTSYLPYGATLTKTPPRDGNQSSWWGSYWAGGWDLYLDNARAIAQAYMPPQQDR
ncbi:hypothetical protein [Cupriavidus sp. BIS7]|jgi:hypothetical protein|uniref:hypothetical protein n=1 Tax=Cupriavidus sp. BIS7 TaxID=1217718 RepID=UPI00031206FA|nr:hypothetical protein [Cupriavidus sp. BIS7]